MSSRKVTLSQMPRIHPESPFMFLITQEGYSRIYIGGTAKGFEVWVNIGDKDFIKTVFPYQKVFEQYTVFKDFHTTDFKTIPYETCHFLSAPNEEGFTLRMSKNIENSVLNNVTLLDKTGHPYVLVGGRMADIKPFFDMLEIILMLPKFAEGFMKPLVDKLELYQEHFGDIEDYRCEHCHNFLDSGECLWCDGKCPTCGYAPLTEGSCAQCGYEYEVE